MFLRFLPCIVPRYSKVLAARWLCTHGLVCVAVCVAVCNSVLQCVDVWVVHWFCTHGLVCDAVCVATCRSVL